MADDLIHSSIYGDTWWNNSCTSRIMFGSSSLCSSSTISDLWSNVNMFEDMKSTDTLTRSTDESLFLHQDWNNVNESHSTTSEWNEALLQTNATSQGNYPIMFEDDFNSAMSNYHQKQQQQCVMELCPKTYLTDQEFSNNTTFKQQMNSDFTTCEVLPTNYPLNPSSSCDYSSTFLQNLFSDDTSTTQKPFLENHQPIIFKSSSASIDDDFRGNNMSGFKEQGAKKTNDDQTFKRPRFETPSSLPTFKVRKEKLGDRITAIQQLVSPFGKTDTASVLHEAIEYIKFLHDQVNVLSTPYMNSAPLCQHQQGTEEEEEDLKSKGLCLVPLSSTLSLGTEPPTDFWTPSLGGAFRNDEWEAWNGGSHIA